MPYAEALFVEGPDDLHAIQHILQNHGIEAISFRDEEAELIPNRIVVKALGGYPNLREQLPVELEVSTELRRVGIVVDADDDVANRWTSIRDLLVRRFDAIGLPDEPMAQGWTGKVITTTGEIAVGIWLMPDNVARGALEEFVAVLVPSQDKLWDYATTCVDELPEQRFADKDRMKALVHTWLAWQQRPRLAIGEAVGAGTFDAHAPHALAFVAWARRLFDR